MIYFEEEIKLLAPKRALFVAIYSEIEACPL